MCKKGGETGLIELQNVSFAYEDGGRQALKNVSLKINKGEFLAIVGHNGSGKSTLAKQLNALLLPSEGCVLVDGMDTKEDRYTFAIRQKVGMVFQNPDNQLVTTIVEEDVAFGPENIGVPTPERARRAQHAFGRPKAEGSHCRHACYGARGACAGRGHGHARSSGQERDNRRCNKAA